MPRHPTVPVVPSTHCIKGALLELNWPLDKNKIKVHLFRSSYLSVLSSATPTQMTPLFQRLQGYLHVLDVTDVFNLYFILVLS